MLLKFYVAVSGHAAQILQKQLDLDMKEKKQFYREIAGLDILLMGHSCVKIMHLV